MFTKLNNISQLSWLLEILETYPDSTRVVKYQVYAQSHQVGLLGKRVNGAIHAQPHYILQDLISLHSQEFREQGHLVGVDRLIDRFEDRLIDACLEDIWQTCYIKRKLRWSFDTFTSYIAYDLRELDWTIDDEKHRSYWNGNDAIEAERRLFFAALKPRLLALFRIIDLNDFETLLGLLPKFLGVEEYSKAVNVPIGWEQGVEYMDGYNKYTGNYTEEIAVARPVDFAQHLFYFERPDLRDAIDITDHLERIWHEIKTARDVKRTSPAR